MWRHPLPKQVATFIYYGVSSVGLTCVCRQQHLWGKRWVFMGLLSGMTRIFTICLQCRLCRMDNICGRDSLRWAAEDTTAKKIVHLIYYETRFTGHTRATGEQ